MEKEDNSKAIQMKKIRTNMSQKPRVLFEENPKIDFISTKLCLFDKTWPCRNVDSQANKILTNMNEEPINDLVSTELCLFDKTWPCRNADYVPWPPWVTTKADIEEKTESSISDCKILTSMSQKPRNDFVSTELCLFDKTWPYGKSNYFMEQTRKMEMEDDMEQDQIGSNDFVTFGPRYEESTEQTRKMEDDMEKHQVDLSILKKTHAISLSKTGFDAYTLRYLSEDDQNKIRLGYGIRVNMYDDESQTTHQVLMRQYGSRKHKYYLTGTWLTDFFQRRGLQVGDTIELSWDFLVICFISMCFIVQLQKEKQQL